MTFVDLARERTYNGAMGTRSLAIYKLVRRIAVFTCLFLLIVFTSNLFAVEVAPKIGDRELIESLAELKAGQTALQQQINGLKESTQQQIAGLQQQMGDLKASMTDLRNLIYVVLAGMFSLFGFVLWDRRAALAPAVRKQEELEKREALIEKALAEYACSEPRLADILRKFQLM